MSATQTRQNTERMKLIPMLRACAMASQATHSIARPSTRRSASGSPGQAAGPPRSASAPPITQASATGHHSQAGGTSVQPSASAAAPASASSTPIATARPAPALLRRPHSQPAAPIRSSVSTANGQGDAAKSAGNSSASKTMAVMTRCLSMVSWPGPAPPRATS